MATEILDVSGVVAVVDLSGVSTYVEDLSAVVLVSVKDASACDCSACDCSACDLSACDCSGCHSDCSAQSPCCAQPLQAVAVVSNTPHPNPFYRMFSCCYCWQVKTPLQAQK